MRPAIRVIIFALICLAVILFAPTAASAAPKRMLGYYPFWAQTGTQLTAQRTSIRES